MELVLLLMTERIILCHEFLLNFKDDGTMGVRPSKRNGWLRDFESGTTVAVFVVDSDVDTSDENTHYPSIGTPIIFEPIVNPDQISEDEAYVLEVFANIDDPGDDHFVNPLGYLYLGDEGLCFDTTGNKKEGWIMRKEEGPQNVSRLFGYYNMIYVSSSLSLSLKSDQSVPELAEEKVTWKLRRTRCQRDCLTLFTSCPMRRKRMALRY